MASTITSKEYNGNGSTKTFTYAFQSYQVEDVKVKVNEVAVTNFTIPNYAASGGTVTFNNTGVNASVCESDGSPKNNLIVRVYRETDITSGSVGEYEAKATYQAGSSIKAADLNNCAKQALYASFENRDQEIQESKIRNGAVTRDKIADDAVNGSKIADDSIDSEHYAADSIDTEHYAANSVDTDALGPDSVTGAQIADNAIDSEHYVDLSIDEAHIAAGAISNNKMAPNSVASGNIVNGTIATTDIANGAITTALLAADAVDSSRLADDACDSEHYTNLSIDTDHIGNLQITTPKLAADAVDSSKLADDACDSEHYTNGSIDHEHLANDIIDGDNIVDDAIASEHIADAAVQNDHIAAATIQGGKIAVGAISATQLGTDSVTVAKIADAELTTLAGMQAGTASILAGSTALTSTLSELNLLDGKSIVTTISSPTDVQLPTAQAVEERIVDLVTDVGGFRPIANETSFPATNPDPEDNAGTIVSIKALASNITSNGSGVVTIANGAGTGNTVTINGFANNDTIEAGKGLLVETTSTLHTYTFHRETLAPADVASASTLVSDFNDRYQVAGSAPSNHPDGSALADGDLWFDTSANVMKVYDQGNTSYAAVTSVGDYKLLTVVPDNATSGTPTYNGPADVGTDILSFDLRDGSNAASITSVGQLLVSLNGVIQKPNAGSWSASNEGFHLEGTNGIKFCTAPNSGASVFVTLIGSATSVNVPATNSIVEAAIQTNVVSEEKLKIHQNPSDGKFLKYTTANGMEWGDVPAGVGGANGVDFNDSILARWGADHDVQISHQGILMEDGVPVKLGTDSDFLIHYDENTSDKALFQGEGKFINGAASKTFIDWDDGDGVDIYFNNSKKFETTNTGVTVTGTVAATAYTGDGSALTGVSSTVLDGCGFQNDQTISSGTYSIPANKGVHSVGPITVEGTVTVTGNWVVS